MHVNTIYRDEEYSDKDNEYQRHKTETDKALPFQNQFILMVIKITGC